MRFVTTDLVTEFYYCGPIGFMAATERVLDEPYKALVVVEKEPLERVAIGAASKRPAKIIMDRSVRNE